MTETEIGLPLGLIEPIPKVQLYEQVSQRIIEQISVGAWACGQRLPSERELASVFGVSRPSLREALGALQMLGIVETQHGSGSWVSENALDVIAKHPGAGGLDFGVSPVALLEARAAVEPTIASLSASRFAPDAEIERLLQMMAEARDWENPAHRVVWSDADRLFHRQIAVHTDNPVLLSVADRIARVMAQPLWRRLRDDMLAVPGRIDASITEHQRIFDALQARLPEDAAASASRHVEVVREYMGLE
jgi:DNA-binding FadR family transcriptional regulator